MSFAASFYFLLGFERALHKMQEKRQIKRNIIFITHDGTEIERNREKKGIYAMHFISRQSIWRAALADITVGPVLVHFVAPFNALDDRAAVRAASDVVTAFFQ